MKWVILSSENAVSLLQKRILQALSLSLLLLIQFLSIQAERSNYAQEPQHESHQSVIKKQVAYAQTMQGHHNNKPEPRQKHSRKMQHVKHVTIKFTTPDRPDFGFVYNSGIMPRNSSYNEQYFFDYSRDINPPPPKA